MLHEERSFSFLLSVLPGHPAAIRCKRSIASRYRRTQTWLRGGTRPVNADVEFPGSRSMPLSEQVDIEGESGGFTLSNCQTGESGPKRTTTTVKTSCHSVWFPQHWCLFGRTSGGPLLSVWLLRESIASCRPTQIDQAFSERTTSSVRPTCHNPLPSWNVHSREVEM